MRFIFNDLEYKFEHYRCIPVYPDILDPARYKACPQLEFFLITHLGGDRCDEDRACLCETGMSFGDEESLTHFGVVEEFPSDKPEREDYRPCVCERYGYETS